MPVMLLCVIVFLIWLNYEIRKANRIQKQEDDTFLDRERKANFIRPADISQLNYITVPINSLPFQQTDDAKLIEIQDKVRTLSEKKILNLTGYSNTDLKLTYGPGNLPVLSDCDHNFTLLVRTLQQWAEYLYEHQETEKTKIILEYAISCKTDVSKSYILLASIYQKEGNYTKIKELKDSANSLHTLMKDHIVKELNSILKY